jgi:signal transduction histidine kinase
VLNDYANISHDFFHEMEGRFNTGFILNYYNDAYNRLSDNFQNLDAFHELINLFPDKVLDEGKLNLLSIQQIKKLLLEKVDNLEKLSLQLHLKNEQLEQINSELHAQSDLVNEQNKKLQDAQNTIEENNKILQNYTQNLEKLVDQRTKDLENANSILKQYNQGLEEHAFAISHHVKAPVARLLGLINLINNHPSEVDSQNILARIEDSAHDLEDILMQLVQSLNIKKDASHIVLESFDLRRMIQSIVEEMKSVYPQVPVQLSVSGKEVIHSDKNYMTDVLRHLLDNIFKFRNPDIELKIEAEILTSDKRANISIRDNGLGFNLALVKNKLFSPFQRFNIDKPGKGMGLYFTRQLVDVLGGAIEIESTPGMGTRVVISLPNNHQPDVARQFTVAP